VYTPILTIEREIAIANKTKRINEGKRLFFNCIADLFVTF
jgi:hypothetical protein